MEQELWPGARIQQQSKFSGRPKHTISIITEIAKGAGFAVLDYGDFFKCQKRLGLLALRGYSQISLIRTTNNGNPHYPTQNCRESLSSYALYLFNPETPPSDSYTEVSEQMLKCQVAPSAVRPDIHYEKFRPIIHWFGMNKYNLKLIYNPQRLNALYLSFWKRAGIGKQSIESRVIEEASYLVKAIRSRKGDSFDISKVLQNAISNNICSVVFGKRFDYDDKRVEDVMNRLLNALKDPANSLASRICTLAPFLKYLPPVVFIFSKFKKELEVSLSLFICKPCDPPASSYIIANMYKDRNHTIHTRTLYSLELFLLSCFQLSFVQVVLYDTLRKPCAFLLFKVGLNATLAGLKDLLAGTETVSSTLTWALLCCLHYPEAQKKLREEILNVLGSDGNATLSQKPKMPYTASAFMQELMRFRAVVPIALPHKTNEDSELNGYFIPKSTTKGVQTMICFDLGGPNIWAVHNDPDFGINRKNLNPNGKQLAQMEIFIYLVSMIQQFEFLPDPNSDKLPEIDDSINGLAMLPYPFCMTCNTLNGYASDTS
ncbi:cytochrome P450 2J6-like [Clavelina lepadiformis]|uniref:cytochrome P450 2J6-like n=1 Tax=Clavelina lepadiformis TaxID=159417 RepID=UPI00404391C9